MILHKLPQVFFGFVKSDIYIYTHNCISISPRFSWLFSLLPSLPSSAKKECSGRKGEPCLICRQHRLSGRVVGEVGVEGSFQGETFVLQDCAGMVCSLGPIGVYLL